jgi:hypothetical protein
VIGNDEKLYLYAYDKIESKKIYAYMQKRGEGGLA